MSSQHVRGSLNDENKDFYIGRVIRSNLPKFLIPVPAEGLVMKKNTVQTGSSGVGLNSRLTIEPESEGIE
ncbi:TPA: hypothetical protein QCR51_004899 [Bacillus cereus]|nr:hypothetical protein [Bacillus cereus]